MNKIVKFNTYEKDNRIIRGIVKKEIDLEYEGIKSKVLVIEPIDYFNGYDVVFRTESEILEYEY